MRAAVVAAFAIALLASCASAQPMSSTASPARPSDESTNPTKASIGPDATPRSQDPSRDVFYHVFVRSLRDSDGDRQGDLRGIVESLDYLQSLGVDTLLLTPLYPSRFYHNYFATDFEGIDAEYGSMNDFHALVAALHARGMKVYLDEEIQYADDRHAWYRESRDNPSSKYADYLLWDDPRHHVAASGPFGIRVTKSFGNPPILLTSVNLKSPQVQAYFKAYLRSWMDPDGDGDGRDGVDGFRIDHMMDDLDNKGVQKDLFATFWRPLFDDARARNPKVRFIAEQADWGYGGDFLTRGDTDFVFAFPLRAAIRAFDRDRIAEAIRGTQAATPSGKRQLVFVENHDMDRLASDPGMTPERLRTAAALNVLLAGTPILYYGQELGMRGRQLKVFDNDENDIGQREAFRWSDTVDADGEAIWYRGKQVYWTQRAARDHDGISVQEQDHDPASLLNGYRRLIALRREHPALRSDAQRVVDSATPGLLVVERGDGDHRAWLVANLTATPITTTLPQGAPASARDLLDRTPVSDGRLTLPAYRTAIVAAP